jgi:hypothetical protein
MEFFCHGLIQQIPTGAHDHPEPVFSTIPGDGKDVLPHERFSPAQHDNRFPGLADLVDDAECFLRGEHSFCFTFAGVNITVSTLQGTPERDVPRDNTRAVRCTPQRFSPFATRFPRSTSALVRFSTIEDVYATIWGDRSDQGSSLWSRQPRSPGQTSPARPRFRRPRPEPGAGSSNRR